MEKREITEICALLSKAQQEMLQLEQETNALYTCTVDEIPLCVERRAACAARVDTQFQQIYQICDADPRGMLRKAVSSQTLFEDVPEELHCIFEARRQLNAVIHRILQIEPQVLERLQTEREKLLEQIRENNRGQSANASRYLGALNSGQDVHFTTQGRKI